MSRTDAAPQVDSVLADALALPEGDRARLAELLLAGLDPQAEADVDEAWRVEVARREAEIDWGEVEAVDWLGVRQRL